LIRVSRIEGVGAAEGAHGTGAPELVLLVLLGGSV